MIFLKQQMNADFVEGFSNSEILIIFLKECTSKSEDEYVYFIDLYSRFKTWFQDGFPSEKIPNRFLFKSEISWSLKYVREVENINSETFVYYGIHLDD